MVALGALVGVWLLRREARRAGLPDAVVDVGIAGVIGGLIGAKLLWTAEHAGEEPLFRLLTSRGGMSWFGGLAGGAGRGPDLHAAGAAAADGGARRRGARPRRGSRHRTPRLLPGRRRLRAPQHAALGGGVPARAAADRRARSIRRSSTKRSRWSASRSCSRACARPARPTAACSASTSLLAGLLRFAIEFLRVDERVLLGLSVAHLASLAAMLAGAALLARRA